jgi:hypothetical protein
MQQTAIPTFINGVRFRSRLEAKWAIMFDQLNWKWEYEPIDLNGYIPDFFILNKRVSPLLIEIKPILSVDDFTQSEQKIIRSGWKNSALILGAKLFWDEFKGTNNPVIGKIKQSDADFFECCSIAKCVSHGTYGVVSEYMGWSQEIDCSGLNTSDPNDYCGTDKTHQNKWWYGGINKNEIEAMWKAASNLIQWKP